VTIVPLVAGGSTTSQIDEPTQLPLFEAIRIWMDGEGVQFDIVDDGTRLTEANIQEIIHSKAYKEQLLAFHERR